ncbi:Nudix family hydrolase [Halopseudomonas salegens]|uniref:8-oxo-dGTP diphosphatase n=1 Tax=Halopseudomonas salegens TaxID=1434072 RepID=A0A1H2EDW1_9GAMM|nr:Nudix family hydrolase [Halopseudomonas salegens]SDT93336.1 8-oxo-dGTPase [Halopseudomonas salegens]
MSRAQRIHVVAAVIRNHQQQILLARRPEHAHQGGLWEFPGGKLEQGESPYAGLCRELHEELGIQVSQARPLLDISHDYPDKQIRLDVWLVEAFSGEPHGAEGQPVRWVNQQELAQYPLPAANVPIVNAARLPECYLITPDLHSIVDLVPAIERAIDSGQRLIQIRQTQWSEQTYRQASEQLVARFGDQVTFMLKGPQPLSLPGCGWHLTARQLTHMAANPESGTALLARCEGPIAASCHNAEELGMAEQLGLDFATLSPLLPTASHAQATPIGWTAAAELLKGVNMPVYLLGGLKPADCSLAFQHGAQGIAAIRGLWPSAN